MRVQKGKKAKVEKLTMSRSHAGIVRLDLDHDHEVRSSSNLTLEAMEIWLETDNIVYGAA